MVMRAELDFTGSLLRRHHAGKTIRPLNEKDFEDTGGPSTSGKLAVFSIMACHLVQVAWIRNAGQFSCWHMPMLTPVPENSLIFYPSKGV